MFRINSYLRLGLQDLVQVYERVSSPALVYIDNCYLSSVMPNRDLHVVLVTRLLSSKVLYKRYRMASCSDQARCPTPQSTKMPSARLDERWQYDDLPPLTRNHESRE